jgi:hypothetical protein
MASGAGTRLGKPVTGAKGLDRHPRLDPGFVKTARSKPASSVLADFRLSPE